MVLGRPKKGPSKQPRPAVVPTQPPVFTELERRGLVIVMSEGAAAPGDPGPRRKPKKPKR